MKQNIIITTEEEKRTHIQTFLENMSPKDKVIVFVSRKAVYVFLCAFFVISNPDDLLMTVSVYKISNGEVDRLFAS